MKQIVTIESLAAGGDGVARMEDGRVVFIPHTAVGDEVEIELTHEKKSFARGAVKKLIKASAARRESGCDHFDRNACGGCQWLHIELDAQHTAKHALVASALRRVVAAESIDTVVEAAPATYWRRRARFHWVRPAGQDLAIIGFTAPKSNRVTPPRPCLQLDKALSSVFESLQAELGPHLHKRGEIDVVLATDDTALVAVRGPHARRGLEALARRAEIAGVVGRGAPLGVASAFVDDGLPVTATGFSQASSAGHRDLAALVAKRVLGGPHGRVLELFAGAGNFTRRIAAAANKVVAVERATGPRVEADNVSWITAEATETLTTLATETFDVIVLDPPRSGAADCVPGLLEIGAQRIVYVSCDPATLGRDLGKLCESAYRVASVTPVDLMPQTAHIEVVTVLERV